MRTLFLFLTAISAFIFVSSQPILAAETICKVVEEYPQCGGTAGLEQYSIYNTIKVIKTQCGNETKYLNKDLGNMGQCPPGGVTEADCFLPVEEHNQCGGSLGLENENPTHTFRIFKIVNCYGMVLRWENLDLGNLNQCRPAAPTAVPTKTPTNTPIPATHTPIPTKVTDSPTPEPQVDESTPVPTPTPMERKLVYANISNYSDYRVENDSGDLGSKSKAVMNSEEPIEWLLSSLSEKKVVYVGVMWGLGEDMITEDYSVELKDGQTAVVGPVKLIAKMPKKPHKEITKVLFRGEDILPKIKDSSFVFSLADFESKPLNNEENPAGKIGFLYQVPVFVMYSDQSQVALPFEFRRFENAVVEQPTPTVTSTPVPVPTERPAPTPTPEPAPQTKETAIIRFARDMYENIKNDRQNRINSKAGEDSDYQNRINFDQNKDRLSVLFLGIGGENALTDSIQVMSYNMNTNTYSQVSFPRDLHAPEVCTATGDISRSRINQAVTTRRGLREGAEVARRAVENATGLSIDHIMVFKFDVLSDLVDRLTGPISVELERDIKDDTYPCESRDEPDPTPCVYSNAKGYHVRPFHLTREQALQGINGKTAVKVARSRTGVGDSDYTRSGRQQLVIEAVVKKYTQLFKEKGVIAKIPFVTDTVSFFVGKLRSQSLVTTVDFGQVLKTGVNAASAGDIGETPKRDDDKSFVVAGELIEGVGGQGALQYMTKIRGGKMCSERPKDDYWKLIRNKVNSLLSQ